MGDVVIDPEWFSAHIQHHQKQSDRVLGYRFPGEEFERTFNFIFSEFHLPGESLSNTIINRAKKTLASVDSHGQKGQFVCVDVGAGNNLFLKEFAENVPGITGLGISLRDMRTGDEKQDNLQRGLLYSGQLSIERIAPLIRNVDLVISTRTFKHLADPLGNLIAIYNNMLAKNGEMYIQMGRRESGIITWNEMTPEVFLKKIKDQGIDISWVPEGTGVIVRMRKSLGTNHIDDSFFTVSHQQKELDDRSIHYLQTNYMLTKQQ